MFKRIGRSLALQFTGFVFLLFLVNGSIFLFADYENQQRMMHFRLARESEQLVQHLPDVFSGAHMQIPVRMMERVRLIGPDGTVTVAGTMFEHMPFDHQEGFSSEHDENDEFTVFTTAVNDDGKLRGYVQIAAPARVPIGDLPLRAFLYLLVSVLISGLTYIIGRSFARRSLKPAEEMLTRLEQFTQDASHELRTPLAVLGSSLDLALKTNQHKEGILSAKEDLKQISNLVERLLQLARVGDFALTMKKTDLSSLVSDTVDKFKLLAGEEGIKIDAKIASGVSVEADGALIRQVTSNLLSNAIKFNKKNGVIAVTLSNDCLQIADTGIGIAKKDLPQIFNRFYQADTSRCSEGYGLGLALAKRILDMHGWKVSVESKEGEGTTFIVSFPKSA